MPPYDDPTYKTLLLLLLPVMKSMAFNLTINQTQDENAKDEDFV
jgi:hypothetical protein